LCSDAKIHTSCTKVHTPCTKVHTADSLHHLPRGDVAHRVVEGNPHLDHTARVVEVAVGIVAVLDLPDGGMQAGAFELKEVDILVGLERDIDATGRRSLLDVAVQPAN
jgi:hypothetical protein